MGRSFSFTSVSWPSLMTNCVMVFMLLRKTDSWAKLDTISAKTVIRWAGKSAWDSLWFPLFHYKFYQYSDQISAAWLEPN